MDYWLISVYYSNFGDPTIPGLRIWDIIVLFMLIVDPPSFLRKQCNQMIKQKIIFIHNYIWNYFTLIYYSITVLQCTKHKY